MIKKNNAIDPHLISNDDCVFCDEITGSKALSTLIKGTAIPHESYMAETDSLVLIPDVSPIIRGHCLIVTRKHMHSFAQAEKDVWNDLSKIKQVAIDYFIPHSSRYFFFEHGASPELKTSGGCIAHAHIHLIPIAIDMLHYLIPFSNQPLSIVPIEMKSSLPSRNIDYFYYEDMNGKGCVLVDPIKPIPRQFVRMVVAKEMNLAEWDWRTVFFREEVSATSLHNRAVGV